jgi:hypothetical protein
MPTASQKTCQGIQALEMLGWRVTGLKQWFAGGRKLPKMVTFVGGRRRYSFARALGVFVSRLTRESLLSLSECRTRQK